MLPIMFNCYDANDDEDISVSVREYFSLVFVLF